MVAVADPSPKLDTACCAGIYVSCQLHLRAPGGSGEHREGIVQAAAGITVIATKVFRAASGWTIVWRTPIQHGLPRILTLADDHCWAAHPTTSARQNRGASNRALWFTRTPVLSAHGTRDPFGTVDELRTRSN
jgi:hypothetical protein